MIFMNNNNSGSVSPGSTLALLGGILFSWLSGLIMFHAFGIDAHWWFYAITFVVSFFGIGVWLCFKAPGLMETDNGKLEKEVEKLRKEVERLNNGR